MVASAIRPLHEQGVRLEYDQTGDQRALAGQLGDAQAPLRVLERVVDSLERGRRLRYVPSDVDLLGQLLVREGGAVGFCLAKLAQPLVEAVQRGARDAAQGRRPARVQRFVTAAGADQNVPSDLVQPVELPAPVMIERQLEGQGEASGAVGRK